MRILITGNRGFVGTVTQRLLEKHDDQVIGYDLMDGKDIRDYNQLDAFVNEVRPDRILHLAAIARFSEADSNPRLAFETNVIGTLNVSNVARKYHIPTVYSSTGSAIMPLNGYEPPFNETIPARGNSVYGSTKAMGEFLIRDCNPHIILRYGHIYGAEKRYHGAVGGFIDRMKKGLAPVLYGGEQTNSFVYVKDIAMANFLSLIAPWDSWNQIYHIGSDEELSTEYVFEVLKKMTGYKGQVEKKEMRTVDPKRFAFDISKARKYLNFEPKYKFNDGVKEMLEELGLLKYDKK